MAQEFSRAFYNSKRWLDCRKAYIGKRMLIDGGLCERCHGDSGYILHHKIVLNESNVGDPSISLNHDNLEFVCKNCHEREHFELNHNTFAPAQFDENGQIIPER